jgi:hypothetical protein
MATLKEDSDSWSATSIIHRDHRHDKGDGYDETKHKKVSKKTRVKKKPGCWGNNGGPHVYVWIGARYRPNEVGQHIDQAQPKWCYRREEEYTVFHWMPWKTRQEHIDWLEKREAQYCAGCFKRTGKTRMKETEEKYSSWLDF